MLQQGGARTPGQGEISSPPRDIGYQGTDSWKDETADSFYSAACCYNCTPMLSCIWVMPPTGNRSSHDINLWFHQGVPRLSPHDSWDRPEPPDMDDVGWSLRPDRSTITRHYVVIVGTLSIRCSKSQDDGVTRKCSVVILFMLCFVSYFYFMVVRVV